MVWVKKIAGKNVFICGICGLGYADPVLAISCEEFCRENKCCSVDLAKAAVYRP